MFSKLTAILAISLVALLASANPIRRGEPSASQCTGGTLQCCNDVQSSDTQLVQNLLAVNQFSVGPNVPVGITCSAISIVDLQSADKCVQQPVCCEQTGWGGAIAIGCSNINL